MRISLFRAVACRLSIPKVGMRGVTTLAENDDLSLMTIQPVKSLLAPNDEDLSHIDVNARPTFNLASLINKSETLQNLLKLNVNLHRIENKPWLVEPLLKLDFEKDIKKQLLFLSDYVEADELGKFITTNPRILNEDLDHMQTRINYLYSKRFDNDMIKRIIHKNPLWLTFNTLEIDRRLGHFQKEFELSGNQVRLLTTKEPRLITYRMHHIKMNTFAIREEMGFSKSQIKILILEKPKLWMMNQIKIIKAFNYLHSEMKISHDTLILKPRVLTYRVVKLKERNEFLKMLGRNQYDPTKSNYVSMDNLVGGTDLEFCTNVAKCNIDEFNLYLKSL